MKVLAGIEKGHPIADTYSDQRRADGREDRKVVPVGYVVAGMHQQAAIIWAPVNAVGYPTVQADDVGAGVVHHDGPVHLGTKKGADGMKVVLCIKSEAHEASPILMGKPNRRKCQHVDLR